MLVVDLGGQYSQLIARRVREARVYSELVGHRVTAAQVRARRPLALVLSGGPASVYAEGAPKVDPGIFELGVPTLGICYGMQLMALELGGSVDRTGVSEFGKTELEALEGALFSGLPPEQTVWMSHRDSVTAPPSGARVTASSPSTPIAAFEEPGRRLYGVQFHPEVVHTPYGQDVLKNFLYGVADARPAWTATAVIEEQVERIRAQVGGERVICGLSGGVDSAVAALLVHKAIGDQLTCVFVDHGLLRANEADAGKEMLRSANQSVPEGVHGLDQATNGTVKRKLLLTGLSLEYLAYRIENADGEFPDLVAAASALAPDEPNAPGPPHERARLYAREVVRPLAVRMMLAARGAGAELSSR